MTIEKVGGGSDQLESRIAINGVTQAKTAVFTENNNPTSLTIKGLFCLDPNDTVELQVANNTGTSNIIVNVANLSLSG